VAKLSQRALELGQQLAQERIKKRAGKLKNTSLVKTLSDNLAKVKTIMTEKTKAQLAENQAKLVHQPAAKTAISKENSKHKGSK
jgi:ribosomal protein L29